MGRRGHAPLARLEDCHSWPRRGGERSRPRRILAGGRFSVGQPESLDGQRQRRRNLPGAVAPALWLGALFVLAALPSCLVWLAGGAAVQRWLQSERAARAFNLAMGALLAASVVLFVR
jgi:hypothetical protein